MIDTRPAHPTKTMIHDDFGPIEIDEKIYPLIWLMWYTGHDTLFCCQGDTVHTCYEGYVSEEHDDAYCWSAQGDRAYISMRANEKNVALTQKLISEFFFKDPSAKVLWDVHFDNETTEFGARVTWRFPQGDIPKLIEFLKKHYTNADS